MRKLEARFHPLAGPDAYIVVGHVILEGGDTNTHPRVELAASLAQHGAPATIMATLRHLVAMTRPRSLERLEALRSRYWSFVPVTSNGSEVHDA